MRIDINSTSEQVLGWGLVRLCGHGTILNDGIGEVKRREIEWIIVEVGLVEVIVNVSIAVEIEMAVGSGDGELLQATCKISNSRTASSVSS